MEPIDVDAILALLEEHHPELGDAGEDRWGGANLCCPVCLREGCDCGTTEEGGAVVAKRP